MQPEGFHILASNAMEVLANGLAELLNQPWPNPLRPEVVLVQSKGMQKWLSLNIAKMNGICANIDFPFPNAFFERLYIHICGPLSAVDPFDPQALGFRIMQLLPRLLELEEFLPLQLYLKENPHPLKLFQLARKIADVFDQYSVFRPEMVLEWERGRTLKNEQDSIVQQRWQVILWQKLIEEHPPQPHRARRLTQLLEKLSNIHEPDNALPSRLMIFGISYLPPYHLRMLDALAKHLPVYLFLLNPCRHYWSDIISGRHLSHLHSRWNEHSASDDELHYDSGNRLLASFGQQGRDFFQLIQQCQDDLLDQFADYDHRTSLGRIQQDILDLVDPGASSSDGPSDPIACDGTIRVSNCHSPMREVEVLLDQLLDILANNPDIEPRDILVMAPDIEIYSPYIHAVFGAVKPGHAKIPYSVADQNVLAENPNIECFLKLLELQAGRFEVSRITSLLEFPAVQKKFGLQMADLPIMQKWIESAGIRWGWDAQSRKKDGLPAYPENTWRMGLDRLLLGYAMLTSEDQLLGGLLPGSAIEGDHGRILGGLTLFTESLQETLQEFSMPRSLSSWQSLFIRIMDLFFKGTDTAERDFYLLDQLISQLGELECAAKFSERIGFEVIHQHIKERIRRTVSEAGFISGGITFCSLLPMRSIPADVICLLGMNHDSFPREITEPAFNLIAAQPQPGDRSKRSDDRYLFLESLISARRFFYLSYVGQDIQDNSIRPPSVVVDEFVDYIHARFALSTDTLITMHPLHAFSPRYFHDESQALFSYSQDDFQACKALLAPGEPVAFTEKLLPEKQNQAQAYALSDLLFFFPHPTRFLLEKRLGVHFTETDSQRLDHETFILNPLEKFHVNQWMLSLQNKKCSFPQSYSVLRATGLLPHGNVGRFIFQQQQAETAVFMKKMIPWLPEGRPFNRPVSIQLDPFQIDGVITNLYNQARVVVRFGRTRPRDLIHLLINHLALLLADDQSLPTVSRLVCEDSVWTIESVENTAMVLMTYIELFRQGMQAPLPFFEHTSYCYAQTILEKGGSRNLAIRQAMKIWQGDAIRAGEKSDPNIIRCFPNTERLPAGFEEFALTIYQQVIRACRPVIS